MAKIVNLLETAIKAKQLFADQLAARRSFGYLNTLFICHLFNDVDDDRNKQWENVVEPFMDKQCGGFNNIANYVQLVLGLYDYRSAQETVTAVRMKWLDDLIAAAVQYGDDAPLPNLASVEEIKEMYKNLR